jgi:thymidine kinase
MSCILRAAHLYGIISRDTYIRYNTNIVRRSYEYNMKCHTTQKKNILFDWIKHGVHYMVIDEACFSDYLVVYCIENYVSESCNVVFVVVDPIRLQIDHLLRLPHMDFMQISTKPSLIITFANTCDTRTTMVNMYAIKTRFTQDVAVLVKDIYEVTIVPMARRVP